ncbi:MAG: adenylate/guanylate cyclase domain-containing protein [Dehalococcoidia bacterium]
MDPVIQYAKTRDGVNIAFSTFGQGPPVVILPVLPLSHLQLEWQMPGMREFLGAFTNDHQLIRYDARGLGLSDRDESDRSLDAHVMDIEAVVDRLGVEKVALFAASYSGPIGIRYAARHSDKVSRLILWCTHAFHGDVVAKLPADLNQQREAVNQLAGVDRDLYIRTYLHRAVGWTESDTANRFVEVAKKSIDLERFFENLANHAAFNATEDLPKVACPTLVFHRPAFVGSSVDVAKNLAGTIPHARLMLMEGDSVAPFVGDAQAVLDATMAFLSEGSRAGGRNDRDNAIRTILFTDLESHTELFQKLGDVGARSILRGHEELVRNSLRANGGEEVKSFGDGFMATFESTQQALRCAIELQRMTAAADLPSFVRLRVGINAGEPIAEGDDFYGNSVTIASELAGRAAGGQILSSSVVRELAAGKGFRFRDLGENSLAGADGPVRVFEVDWQETTRAVSTS